MLLISVRRDSPRAGGTAPPRLKPPTLRGAAQRNRAVECLSVRGQSPARRSILVRELGSVQPFPDQEDALHWAACLPAGANDGLTTFLSTSSSWPIIAIDASRASSARMEA